MDFKQLLQDDDAVSPVIGVILMVAITVILAAVIGTFVLGLGDQVQETAPTADLNGDQGTTTISSQTLNEYTISHEGGDGLSSDNVEVTVDGNPAIGADGSENAIKLWFSGSDDISAGSSVTAVGYYTGSNYEGDVDGTTTISTSSDYAIDGNTNLEAINSGQTVRVTWQAEGGDRSSTLFQEDVN